MVDCERCYTCYAKQLLRFDGEDWNLCDKCYWIVRKRQYLRGYAIPKT